MLDDSGNLLARLYALHPSTSIAKNLVIDRQGIVRLSGHYVPFEEQVKVIDELLSRDGP